MSVDPYRQVRRRCWIAAILVASGSGAAVAQAETSPATVVQQAPPTGCAADVQSRPWTYADVLSRALCVSPTTREAWSNVLAQYAAVGVSESAFLPSLIASLQRNLSSDVTSIAAHSELSSATRRFASTQGIQMNWTLFDFGKRAADLNARRAQHKAAQASYAAAILDVYAKTAREYFGAEAAIATALTDAEIEATAARSYRAARERTERGVAPISDALQAQTALADATLQKEKSEGQRHVALGTLSIHLGISPWAPIELAPVEPVAESPVAAAESLVQQAVASHPSVMEAEALLNAASATSASVRSEGLPSISLSGAYTHNNTPIPASLGQPLLPASAREKSLTIAVSVPLFEGFGREPRIRQADQLREAQRAHLEEVRRQVSADVWSAFFAVREARRSYELGQILQSDAEMAYEASQERYRAGVGNILELLSAQTALATARQRVKTSLTSWRETEVALAAKVGLPSTSD